MLKCEISKELLKCEFSKELLKCEISKKSGVEYNLNWFSIFFHFTIYSNFYKLKANKKWRKIKKQMYKAKISNKKSSITQLETNKKSKIMNICWKEYKTWLLITKKWFRIHGNNSPKIITSIKSIKIILKLH